MFIHGAMHWMLQGGFSVLLPAAYVVWMFREKLKLSRIMGVPQVQRQPCLILLNLSVKPDEGTPSGNDTTDREVAPNSIQFGRAFSCILQAMWEVDPAEGPVRVSKVDVMDAYYCGTLRTSQVSAFAYVVPSAL